MEAGLDEGVYHGKRNLCASSWTVFGGCSITSYVCSDFHSQGHPVANTAL